MSFDYFMMILWGLNAALLTVNYVKNEPFSYLNAILPTIMVLLLCAEKINRRNK